MDGGQSGSWHIKSLGIVWPAPCCSVFQLYEAAFRALRLSQLGRVKMYTWSNRWYAHLTLLRFGVHGYATLLICTNSTRRTGRMRRVIHTHVIGSFVRVRLSRFVVIRRKEDLSNGSTWQQRIRARASVP